MIGFAGLSHLGIVSSIAAASKGFEVLGYDPDSTRCEELTKGRLPIVEAGLPELLAEHRARIRWTADPGALKDCEVVFCAADVPTLEDDQSDLSGIRALIDTMSHALNPGCALVVLSQVPPGFTRALAGRLGERLNLFYQVETLIIGRAVERALQPEQFIVGCHDCEQPLPSRYAGFLAAFGCPVYQMRYESAELAKCSINLFLASSLATANTLAELCEAIGADWSEVIPALTSDRRIGPHAYVRPGLGIAGGNLERDLATVRALAQTHGTDAGIVDACLVNSRYRRDWVLSVLYEALLSKTPDAIVAVWGLAYKPGTSSTKHAPALSLLDALGGIAVQAYDPVVALDGRDGTHVTQTSSALDACRGADALAIMTPWPAFSDVPLTQVRELMRGRLVVDPFGALDRTRCAELGLTHLRLGAGVQSTSQHTHMAALRC